jgi:hypothetical protein
VVKHGWEESIKCAGGLEPELADVYDIGSETLDLVENSQLLCSKREWHRDHSQIIHIQLSKTEPNLLTRPVTSLAAAKLKLPLCPA